MKPIILLSAILLGACAPAIKSTMPVVTAPPARVDIAPQVKTVWQAAKDSGTVSAKLEGQVATLQRTVATVQDGMRDAIAEADKLRAAKTATEAQLTDLYALVMKAGEQVNKMAADLAKAQTIAKEQETLRADVDAKLTALLADSAAKDAEMQTVRSQLNDAGATLSMVAKERDALQAKVTKQEGSAALGRFVKWMIGLLIAGVLAIIALKFLFPGLATIRMPTLPKP
jgi:chromosome segregation ATPase